MRSDDGNEVYRRFYRREKFRQALRFENVFADYVEDSPLLPFSWEHRFRVTRLRRIKRWCAGRVGS